jgi:hypothetical protein
MSAGFARRPDSKYEMPTVFGPTEIPDLSSWGRVHMVSISFVTEHESVRGLVPAAFAVPELPVVTVSRMTYEYVDYLGGRGYNEVTVGIGVTHGDADDAVRGSWMPIVWVDDFRPIVIGREYMGYAKFGAEFEPITVQGDQRHFAIHEYGTRLLQGSVSALTALDGDDLARVQHGARNMVAFGWKHIAGPDGKVDADYPTMIPLRFEWDTVARGEASIEFNTPTWKEAPHSSRILGRLAGLPVLRRRPGFVASGHGSIDRRGVRRLDPSASSSV